MLVLARTDCRPTQGIDEATKEKIGGHPVGKGLLNVTAVKLLDNAFVAQPGFSLKSFASQSFGVFQERPAKVAWRFSAKAAPDAREFNDYPRYASPLPFPFDGQLVMENPYGVDYYTFEITTRTAIPSASAGYFNPTTRTVAVPCSTRTTRSVA